MSNNSNVKSEIGLESDDFGRQKQLNHKDSVAQIVLNILFMVPGNMPNMPHIGLNIRQYVYAQEGSFDVNELKSSIVSQCNELLPYMISSDVTVQFTEHEGIGVLLIGIPLTIDDEDEVMVVGLSSSKNPLGNISMQTSISYQFVNLAQ